MQKVIFPGVEIWLLGEDDRYPSASWDSATMLAIREDDEHNFWLYVGLGDRWKNAYEHPFKTEGEALEAAINYDSVRWSL